MQSLEFDTVIVVTATFGPDIPASDSMKPKRAVSEPNASFTHASISAAPYKLSVSREDRKPYIFANAQFLNDWRGRKTRFASCLKMVMHSSMSRRKRNISTMRPPTSYGKCLVTRKFRKACVPYLCLYLNLSRTRRRWDMGAFDTDRARLVFVV
jgi:hypothetical protein